MFFDLILAVKAKSKKINFWPIFSLKNRKIPLSGPFSSMRNRMAIEIFFGFHDKTDFSKKLTHFPCKLTSQNKMIFMQILKKQRICLKRASLRIKLQKTVFGLLIPSSINSRFKPLGIDKDTLYKVKRFI